MVGVRAWHVSKTIALAQPGPEPGPGTVLFCGADHRSPARVQRSSTRVLKPWKMRVAV